MLTYVCPACQRTLRVSAENGGKKARCPACATLSLIPTPAVPAEPAALSEQATVPPAAPPNDMATRTIAPALDRGKLSTHDGPAAGTPSLIPPPSVGAPMVPGYQIERELGRGGMGVVYQARHVKLKRVVALKMILAGGHAGAAEFARFRTEAEAIASLQHPNIVQVYEIGEHDGRPFISLEFCAGGALDSKLNGTPLPPLEAAELVETLAQAMHAAHRSNVIHRDLKPANVLLTADGTPKITDFGLAKKLDVASGQTQSGAIMGTPSYMAPEQAGGKSEQMGPAADIYALGAILYELLTGRPPFKAATPLDTIMQVVSDEPVPPRQLQPKIPRDVEMICLKCLEKQPSRRYATALALADDLRRFRKGDLIRALPTTILDFWIKWVKKRPAVAALSFSLGLLVLFAIPFFSLWMQSDEQRLLAEKKLVLAEKKSAEAERSSAADLKLAKLLSSSALQALNEKLHAIEPHVLFSPDGRYLTVRNFVGATTVWDARTGKRLFMLNTLSEKVAFTREPARNLALVGASTTAWLGSSVGEVPFLATAALLSRRITCQLVALDSLGTVTLWEVPSGKRQWLAAALRQLVGAPVGLEISPDGQRLLVASDSTIKILDMATGKEWRTLTKQAQKISGIAFHPDGRHVVSMEDRAVKLWDLRTGTAVTLPSADWFANQR